MQHGGGGAPALPAHDVLGRSSLACSPASDVDDEGGPHKSLSPGAHDHRICYDEGNISVEDLAAPESLLIGAKHVAAGMHWSIAG